MVGFVPVDFEHNERVERSVAVIIRQILYPRVPIGVSFLYVYSIHLYRDSVVIDEDVPVS